MPEALLASSPTVSAPAQTVALSLHAARALLRALGSPPLEVHALTSQPTANSASALSSAAPLARAVLTTRQLFLPDALLGTRATTRCARRAAVAHALAHRLFSPAAQSSAGLKPMSMAVMSVLEDARVEALLGEHWPGIGTWFVEALRAQVQPHRLDVPSLFGRLALALADASYVDDNYWVNKGRTLYQEAIDTHGLHDAAAVRRVASILANDLGQMRVPFDPQRYTVPWAYRDDNSYLWHHARDESHALLEPSDEPPPEDSSAELMPSPPEGEAEDPSSSPPSANDPQSPAAPKLYTYPEWNYRNEVLRPHWCTVLEWSKETGDPFNDLWGDAQASARAAKSTPAQLPPVLRLPLPKRASHLQRLRRQSDGDELDWDAALDAALAQRMGRDPDERLYQRNAPRHHELSLVLLIDVSQSTAAPSSSGGASATPSDLLAEEIAQALMLAQSARAAGHRVAVHGFCSDTRERVHYQRLLDFDTPLTAEAIARVWAVQPRYSTRLGAALRHASAHLSRERSAKRALLVLTDGEPSDIDVHDARYLVEDARHAAQAASRRGQNVFCLTLDAAGAETARRIFGPHHQKVVTSSRQLAQQLRTLYARLA